MEVHYCWRCEADLPFLNENEYSYIEPYLSIPLPIKKIEGKEALSIIPMGLFEHMTGYRLNDWGDINHHRRSLHGPECSNCGHLLRTPQARFCANCSKKAED